MQPPLPNHTHLKQGRRWSKTRGKRKQHQEEEEEVVEEEEEEEEEE